VTKTDKTIPTAVVVYVLVLACVPFALCYRQEQSTGAVTVIAGPSLNHLTVRRGAELWSITSCEPLNGITRGMVVDIRYIDQTLSADRCSYIVSVRVVSKPPTVKRPVCL
jgi:hypothetical protein